MDPEKAWLSVRTKRQGGGAHRQVLLNWCRGSQATYRSLENQIEKPKKWAERGGQRGEVKTLKQELWRKKY